jgi:hypothetical protein
VISGVAFCPEPPLLVPAIAQGAAPELAVLREHCAQALRAVAADGRTLVLLGGAEASAWFPAPVAGTLAGFGLPGEIWLGTPNLNGTARPAAVLPASLTVGAWLVAAALGADRGAFAVAAGPDFAGSAAGRRPDELAARRDLALVVLGDGSARRRTNAPGYLDERAADFDATVAAALSSGDPASLGKLDLALGGQLLAAGVRAWHAAGQVLGGRTYDAALRYDGAPYGVGYFVASWTARG